MSGDQTIARHTGIVLDLLGLFQDIFHFIDHAIGLFQGAARSGTDVDHQGSLILLGHQSGLGGHHQPYQQHGGGDQARPDHPAMVDSEHHALLIFTQHGVEGGVVGRLDAPVETLGALRAVAGTHDHGAQGRTEHQCGDHGETYRRGHRDTELGVEDTGGTAHEGHGDKHRHEDAGTGDDRHRHVAHRVFRRLIGGFVASVELRLHRLDHHDRIIHHRTDGQHQGEQRQDVQAESGRYQAGEGTHQGDDDRYGGDQGRLEILQEEINYQDHQENGDDQGLHHVVDGGEKEVVRTHHRDELRPFRQILAHARQLFRELGIDRCGVRASHLVNQEGHTWMGVHLAAEAIAQCAQLYLCHILEAQHGAILLRAHHDVLELLHAFQATPVFHRELEGILRVLAQGAGRCLQVLLSQDGGDVGRHQAILRHTLRFEPDTHTVGIAQGHHVTHTVHTLQLRNHVDVEVVGQEGLVVGVVAAHQGVDLQKARLALHGGHTDSGHLGGQQTLRLADTVLHVHRRHVGIGSLLEIDRDLRRTVVGGG